MNLVKTTLNVGLEKPVRLLHITDTHLCFADERDCAEKQLLARNRDAAFRQDSRDVRAQLDEMIDYANANCDAAVHTGDLIDFVSVENLEQGAAALNRANNLLFATGNHEFSQYVGEAFEDTAYRMNSFRQVSAGLGRKLLFDARTVGGVNLVALDSGYYQIENWQLERLKIEAEKGLPMILCMHTPLYTPELYEESLAFHHGTCAYLVGCGERELMGYEEWRAVQQRPTADTLRAVEYIRTSPQIVAVLAGHIHTSVESTLPGGKPQLVTGGSFAGIAREITLL